MMACVTSAPENSHAAVTLSRPGPPAQEQESRTNLLVHYLDKATDDAELLAFFSTYGEVVSCMVQRDIHTGESRRFGFVRFVSSACAALAKDQTDGALLRDRAIGVQWARSQYDNVPTTEDRQRMNKLFIRNIPTALPESKLMAMLTHYGEVTHISVHDDTSLPTDEGEESNTTSDDPATTAQSLRRRIAFVTFREAGAAEAARVGLHNTCPAECCNGIPLMTKLAPRSQRREDKVKPSASSSATTKKSSTSASFAVGDNAKSRIRGRHQSSSARSPALSCSRRSDADHNNSRSRVAERVTPRDATSLSASPSSRTLSPSHPQPHYLRSLESCQALMALHQSTQHGQHSQHHQQQQQPAQSHSHSFAAGCASATTVPALSSPSAGVCGVASPFLATPDYPLPSSVQMVSLQGSFHSRSESQVMESDGLEGTPHMHGVTPRSCSNNSVRFSALPGVTRVFGDVTELMPLEPSPMENAPERDGEEEDEERVVGKWTESTNGNAMVTGEVGLWRGFGRATPPPPLSGVTPRQSCGNCASKTTSAATAAATSHRSWQSHSDTASAASTPKPFHRDDGACGTDANYSSSGTNHESQRVHSCGSHHKGSGGSLKEAAVPATSGVYRHDPYDVSVISPANRQISINRVQQPQQRHECGVRTSSTVVVTPPTASLSTCDTQAMSTPTTTTASTVVEGSATIVISASGGRFQICRHDRTGSTATSSSRSLTPNPTTMVRAATGNVSNFASPYAASINSAASCVPSALPTGAPSQSQAPPPPMLSRPAVGHTGTAAGHTHGAAVPLPPPLTFNLYFDISRDDAQRSVLLSGPASLSKPTSSSSVAVTPSARSCNHVVLHAQLTTQSEGNGCSAVPPSSSSSLPIHLRQLSVPCGVSVAVRPLSQSSSLPYPRATAVDSAMAPTAMEGRAYTFDPYSLTASRRFLRSPA